MIKLFYSPHEKNYYLIQEKRCDRCNMLPEGWAVLVSQWNRKKSMISLFCKRCFNSIRTYSNVIEYKLVLMSEPPYDSFPVIIRPPELADARNTSVFDIAKLESVKTTDMTRYAFRNSIEGAKIGNLDFKRHDSGANKRLTVIEFDKLVDSMIIIKNDKSTREEIKR